MQLRVSYLALALAGAALSAPSGAAPAAAPAPSGKIVIDTPMPAPAWALAERKLLDEKQQRLHTSLQQSAMEWRQTFSAIDFPVLIVDLAGSINIHKVVVR